MSKTIELTISNQIVQIVGKQKEIARNQIAYIPHYKVYINKITKLLTNPIGNFPPRNMMTEQSAQVSLLIVIGGDEKYW